MKKHFILFILVIFLFASCSTTEEIAEDMPEIVEIEQPEVVAADIVETASDDVVEDETEEILDQEVLSAQEAVVQESEETVVQQTLTARDLVDQISGTILLPDSPQDLVKDIPVIEVAPEAFEETERIEEEAVAVEENVEALPADEQSVTHIAAQDVLEEKLDFNYVRVITVVISIILLFTIASIIRNRFFQPLAKSISVVLAVLFAAIPMLIGTIITGWSSIYFLFLLLLSCYFVFRSKASSINYR